MLIFHIHVPPYILLKCTACTVLTCSYMELHMYTCNCACTSVNLYTYTSTHSHMLVHVYLVCILACVNCYLFLPQTTSDFLVSYCSVHVECMCTCTCTWIYMCTYMYIVRDGSSLYLKHVVTFKSMYMYMHVHRTLEVWRKERRETTQKRCIWYTCIHVHTVPAYNSIQDQGTHIHVHVYVWSSVWDTLPWFIHLWKSDRGIT